MGFSVSASTAIVFAGMFLAVGILYPAVSNGFEQVQDAQVERDSAQLDMRNTAIEITDTSDDQLTVKNTGTTSLTLSEVDLIVDGDYQERNEDFDIVNDDSSSNELWLPGEEITISGFSGDHAKVVTDHGISAAEDI